jgi:hypothetical protein
MKYNPEKNCGSLLMNLEVVAMCITYSGSKRQSERKYVILRIS